MLDVSVSVQLAFRQGRVSGECYFKLLNIDIEFRLEPLKIIKNHRVFLETFFARWLGSIIS